MKLKSLNRILILIGLVLIVNSCKEKLKDSNNILIWESFKTKLTENDLNYLIENSTDSIQCVDCINEYNENKIPSRIIFKNFKEKLYNSELLDKKEYSIYENDSIIRITYSFKKMFGNESSDIAYMFDKINDKYLFTGMITIP